MKYPRKLIVLLTPLILIGCVATNTRDFPVTPFYSGLVTDALTGQPLSDVLIHIATLRRLPDDAVTVTTDASGAYLAGVIGHSAWSVSYAAPADVTCRATITFMKAGYATQREEDAGPCSRAPKVFNVALTRSEPASAEGARP